MTRRLRAALIGVVLSPAPVASALAAIPAGQASFAVSVTVLPTCNSTACRTAPFVAHYGPADGQGQPGFELSPVAGQPVLTVTY